MADGILGLGSAGSQGLSAEMIEKLKKAEREGTVKPIETQIENWDVEVEQFAKIEAKLNEILEAAKKLNLFSSGGNAFEEVFAKTSGTSASFDASDTSNIKTGTTTVNITQLAQKSVHTSGDIKNIDEKLGKGTLTIQVGSGSPITVETEGKTYKEIVDQLNLYSSLDVSLEKVGDGTHRMIVKGSESGLANQVTISSTDDSVLGFTQTQPAKNLEATIDGISYNLSSNNIMLQNGLSITALEEGVSSISIQRDTAAIQTAVQDMVKLYNDLVDTVAEYTLSAESKIADKSTLRNILQDVKNIMFGDSYGGSKNNSLFNFGIELGANGYLVLDKTKFSDAVTNNFDGIKGLFIGTAENEGIGTKLKSYMDEIKGFGGIFSTMGDGMSARRENLEEEKNKAIELLDNKYAQMTAQFAAYTTIITQFENSFSGLQMIIAQSIKG